MNAANETKDVSRLSLAQTAKALLAHYLGNRKVLVLLAIVIVGAGVALNWSWLVAAGIAPILLALAPCAAICALDPRTCVPASLNPAAGAAMFCGDSNPG